MLELPSCLRACAVGVVLMAGCAAFERAPQQAAAAGTAGAVLSNEARASSVAATTGLSPSLSVVEDALASAPVARPAEPARPGSARANLAKPAALPVAKPAPQPPLDVKSLEARLKETKAIGVFSKLALKNQIDDLLERFRAFYQGRIKTSLAELRRSFDLLVMKTLALLQDADPPLAGAVAASRESLWGILSDPAKFATF